MVNVVRGKEIMQYKDLNFLQVILLVLLGVVLLPIWVIMLAMTGKIKP